MADLPWCRTHDEAADPCWKCEAERALPQEAIRSLRAQLDAANAERDEAKRDLQAQICRGPKVG